MPGLLPGIHDLRCTADEIVDGLAAPGHDTLRDAGNSN
jgi:hypothetical protein